MSLKTTSQHSRAPIRTVQTRRAQPNLQRAPMGRSPNATEMQQRMGNRRTQAWLAEQESAQPLQTKLTVGEPDDIFEKEADRVAETVMRMPEPATPEDEETKVRAKPIANQITPLVQRIPEEEAVEEEPVVQQMSESEENEENVVAQRMSFKESGEGDEEEELAQTKPLVNQQLVAGERLVQPKGVRGQTPQVSPATAANIDSLKGGGRPLPRSARSFFEPRFGADFSQVRVQTDTRAAATAKSINAKAFTIGRDIAFGANQYAPESHEGRQLLAHELTHVVQQQRNKIAPKIQLFRIRVARDVPSLVIREYTSSLLPARWAALQRKMAQRDRLILSALSRVSTGSSAHSALTNLSSRWPSLKRLLSDTSFDPSTGRLPSRSAITAAITSERTDQSALTGRGYRFVRGAIDEFITVLNEFLRYRDTLDAERTEYHRFDNLFTHSDVLTLIGAIPHANFTTADVKALVSQETGDLTNWAVHGISRTSAGHRQHILNRRGYIGFGQHSTTARNEAITWAASQGVTIPARPDPRRIPALSIKLTAAYLGRVMDMLYPQLPDTKPSGDELKKMVFASYNDGHARVYRAARRFVGSTPRNYTWDNIKNTSPIRSHARNYVAGIISRIG